MKPFVIIFFSILTVNLYPQITEITRLPFQDESKEYLESSPVVISENEVLIFYCTGNSKVLDYSSRENDTLYYCRSTDSGQTWSSPVFVTEIGKIYFWQVSWYLTSLRTSTGRIILAWADWDESKINLMYSDDDGLNWSETLFISSFYRKFITLSELDSGKIFLSYIDSHEIRAYYRESLDNGDTWSQGEKTFYSGDITMRSLSFINLHEKTLAFFEYDNGGIYYKVSYDNGLFWSENIPVIDLLPREHNPSVLKFSDNWLWVIYQVEDTTYNFDNQNDIYYIQSFDGGASWNQPQRFTQYVGEDNFLNSVMLKDKPFITFSTTRFGNKPKISFAKIGETIEKFRPPYIRYISVASDSLEKRQWLVTTKVIDDKEVASVNVSFEDGTSDELFDDGKHNDGDSSDNIFANTFLFNSLPPSKEDIIDVNKLTLPFSNKGILANVRVKYEQNSIFTAIDNAADKCEYETTVVNSLIVPASYEEGRYLFSGGFILSGYTNGEMWANAVASAMLVEDYMPGMVGSEKNDPLNKIYSIRKNDAPFGYYWQKWRDAVSLGAEFYDGDGDGVYNPVDKNWNGTWEPNEDMPLLIGDITAWCVYNDGLPKEYRRWNTVDPQGIEVRQTIFASNNPDLEEIIFIRYSILNTGTVSNVMDSVYFGIWEDGDLGDYTDDVVGCDTLLNSSFYYNNTPDDIYGDNCPSFFTSFLQGPIIQTNDNSDKATVNYGILIGQERIVGLKNLDISSHVFFIGGTPLLNDPDNKLQARNYLEGKTRLGEYPDPCNFPYCEVRGGINCSEVNHSFWASGDPVEDVGWISRTTEDTRNLISTGPFKLEKDKPQEIIVAYVMGRGTDPLNSVTIARDNVQRAIAEYQSNFASMTYSPPPATNPVTSYVLYQNYPNPFNPSTTIRYEIPQDGIVTIKVYDILGQEVATILNEFRKAGRYEIKFNAKGLASGVYIYRMEVNDFIESKKMIVLK